MRHLRRFTGLAAAAAAMALVPAAAAAATPGQPDPTFGTGGITSIGTGTQLNGVAVQADGEVVAAGTDGSGGLLVQRFSTSGAPQPPFSAGAGVGQGVAIQPDGKIVVAGYDSFGMVVERFNPGGSLDTGFGSGGAVHVVAGARANAVALGPNGTIIAAGQSPGPLGFQQVAVVRLTSSGALDPSFGSGGVDPVNLGEDSVGKGLAVQGDGRIVLSGSIGPGTHQAVVGFVARLNAAGALDPSFGSGGETIIPPQSGGAASTINAVALDPAGGIVMAGGGTTSNQSIAIFGRLTCSGTADSSFNGSGVETAASSSGFDINPVGANGVAVAAGRRLIGGGAFKNSGLTEPTLWGFEAGGSPDFANTSTTSAAQINAVTVGVEGNIVVAGSNVPAGLSPSGFVARYTGFGPPASSTGSACGGAFIPPSPTTSAPTVTAGAASSISSSAATLTGSVNPNGQSTSYYFQWGRSTSYGSVTAVASAGSGSATLPVAATITGLSPGTTYHFRLVATNATGASIGADGSFTTASAPPPPPHPAPAISAFGQSHNTWGESKPDKRHKRPQGTTFSFTLNEAARVTLTFTHTASGRKVNGKCVAPTHGNKSSSSCRRTVTNGSISSNAKAGKNSLSFSGTISRSNKLGNGSYRVTITARASGKTSKSRSLTFTIVS